MSSYTIENDLIIMTVSSRGGEPYSARLKEYKTHDSLPVVLFNGDSTVFGYKFFTVDNKPIKTNELYFKPENYSGPVVVTVRPVKPDNEARGRQRCLDRLRLHRSAG